MIFLSLSQKELAIHLATVVVLAAKFAYDVSFVVVKRLAIHLATVVVLAAKFAFDSPFVVVKRLAIHSATVVVFAARSKGYVSLFAFYCAVLALPRVLFSPTPILYHRTSSVTTIFRLIA